MEANLKNWINNSDFSRCNFFRFNEFLPPIRNGSQLDNKIKMINNKKKRKEGSKNKVELM